MSFHARQMCWHACLTQTCLALRVLGAMRKRRKMNRKAREHHNDQSQPLLLSFGFGKRTIFQVHFIFLMVFAFYRYYRKRESEKCVAGSADRIFMCRARYELPHVLLVLFALGMMCLTIPDCPGMLPIQRRPGRSNVFMHICTWDTYGYLPYCN